MNEPLLDQKKIAAITTALLSDGPRFVQILEQVFFGVLVVDAESHAILYANRFVRDLSGYKAHELIGHECHQLVCPANRGNCPITDRGESLDRAERCLVTSSGAEVQVLKTVIQVELGGRNCLIEVFLDLSELEQARKVMEQERDRAQNYLDLVNVVVLALDPQGRISMINRQGAEILGQNESELLGQDWFEFVPEAQREEVRRVFASIMRGDEDGLDYFENTVLNSRGEERLIAWQNRLLTDAEGRPLGTLGAGEDVTLRRETEHELDKRMAELTQFNSIAVDRELRMIELKSEVNDLLAELGRSERYDIVE